MLEIMTFMAMSPITTWLAVLLIALLTLQVLISATESQGRWKALGHFLNLAIVPLLVIFSIIVAIRLIAIL